MSYLLYPRIFPMLKIEESKMTFQSVKSALRKFGRDETGATAIEYGLIAGLIAVAIITAVSLLGDDLTATFTAISTELQGVVPPSGP